ncbi:MAG: hypothetical protein KF760_16535 [Candidatus Eremiobacteraeota bacterium]|nr:hypothetical protein [Candidatus Eremiobacteraeota bacterium]MCW5867608.1 hypothetical protein [Candidatus Eremiobacteraeota bacterium]
MFKSRWAARFLLSFLCLATFFLGYEIWPWQLGNPVDLQGDVLQCTRLLKSVTEPGGEYRCQFLGAPFIAEHYGFPDPFVIHHPLLWLLSLVTKNIYLVLNLILLLTFWSAGLVAYEVLLRLGCRSAVAVPIAWIYASLPNHLERYDHWSLAFYASAPLAILYAVRCLRGERLSRLELLLAPLCGLFGAYFAFFSYFIVLAAGLLGAWFRRSLYPLRPAFQVCTLIGLAFLLALWPALKGKSADSAFMPPRQPTDLTRWALNLDRLVLPAHSRKGHPLYKIARRYYANFPAPSETDESPYLGVLAVLGALVLFLGRGKNQPDFPHLRVLATVIFLTATVGGFSELFTLVIGPAIRCYNRISFYLAFVLLAALALRLQQVRWTRGRWLALGLISLLGFIDQLTSVPRRSPSRWAEQVRSDREFVAALEARLPRSARLWQYPYVAYPETPPLFQEGYYGLGRCYSVSSKLHWSWGALRGSSQERFQSAFTTLALPQQLELLRQTGFAGLTVERRAFPDNGAELEAQLHSLGLKPEVQSPDGFLVYYPLDKAATVDQAESQRIFENKLIELSWNDGKIDFGRGGWGNLYLRAGWSDPEDSGYWTVQKSGFVRLPCPPGQHSAVGLKILIYPYIGRPKVQRLQIFQAGERLAWFEFRTGKHHWIHFNAKLPALLELRVERPTQPSFEFESDTRSLGVKLERLEVVEPFKNPY